MLVLSPHYRPFIRAAGLGQRRREPYTNLIPPHLTYLVNEVHVGWMHLVIDGDTVELGEGDLWLVTPDRPQAVAGADPELNLLYAHFTVDQNPGWADAGAIAFNNADTNRHLLQPQPEAVWGCKLPTVLPHTKSRATQLGRIVPLWRRGNPNDTAMANALLDELLAIWWTEARPAPTPEQDSHATEERLLRAEIVASQHVGIDFGVDDMAAVAGLSRSHFTVVYRRSRGRTPRQFINALRIEEAKRLLTTTEATVGEISETLAYSNHTAFVRMFTQAVGTPPGTWRESRRLGLTPDRAE